MKPSSQLRAVPAKTKTDPRVGLLNPKFVYVPAANTNIRLLFERVRQQMAQRSQA